MNSSRSDGSLAPMKLMTAWTSTVDFYSSTAKTRPPQPTTRRFEAGPPCTFAAWPPASSFCWFLGE